MKVQSKYWLAEGVRDGMDEAVLNRDNNSLSTFLIVGKTTECETKSLHGNKGGEIRALHCLFGNGFPRTTSTCLSPGHPDLPASGEA